MSSNVLGYIFLFVLLSNSAKAQDTLKWIEYTGLPNSMFGQNMAAKAADINNDGLMDLIFAREYQRNALFINNGTGFVDSSSRFPLRNWDSEEIAIADFNNDGHLDIIFANEDTQVHEFYINTGNNSFITINNKLPASIANSVIDIDLNNDLFPDLIFGNAGQNFALINNGDTSFTDETAARLPLHSDVTQDIALGDINNDGFIDIVFGNEDGNRILINDGTGKFTDETAQRIPLVNEETRKVILADVDQDFDLDIFFCNVAFIPGKLRQNRLLINDGTGHFTDVTSSRLPVDNEHTMDAAFIDLNDDGYLDLVTANIFFNRPVKAFLNKGDTLYVESTSEVFPPGITAEGIGIIVGDFNGDFLNDIFIVNRRTPQQPNTRDRLILKKNPNPTGLYERGSNIPGFFELLQNYPNPFNPNTKIEFSIPDKRHVSLKVYNIVGELAADLLNQELNGGRYRLDFNAAGLSSGVYLYIMNAGEFSLSRKMIVLK